MCPHNPYVLYAKAVKVIKSCVTWEQLNVAETYLQLVMDLVKNNEVITSDLQDLYDDTWISILRSAYAVS